MSQGRIEQIAPPHEAYERPATPFVASFLGKTNVLKASVAGGQVILGDGRWPAPAGSPPQVLATVRPEKIGFTNGGTQALAGQVATRIFQGNHWLYQIDTALGRVTVIRQNSGESAPTEGESVQLTWRPEDMSVRPAEAAR
jgi:putative spermidine/putrescine transport system ATP-binding protein